VLTVGVCAGCTGDDSPSRTVRESRTATSSAPPDDPDTHLIATVVADEQRLVRAYAASTVGRAQIDAALSVLADHHRSRLRILGERAADARPTRPASSPAAALGRLGRLEAGVVERRRRGALAARSGDLARILAAMAAGSAQHVVVLAELADGLRSVERPR